MHLKTLNAYSTIRAPGTSNLFQHVNKDVITLMLLTTETLHLNGTAAYDESNT